ncbi:MAG: hypothetical protein Ct9H300mP17_03210 [Candidatus Nitrosopelagicus sp.]|nr:MAG: hypothetical protein Ct9H300mP17_03210 [Candidatus Nitrosopelagicus sp.]
MLRESLLDEVYTMGENFVEAAKRVVAPGMNGPFVLREFMMRMLNLHRLNFRQELLQEPTSTWTVHHTIHYYSMKV